MLGEQFKSFGAEYLERLDDPDYEWPEQDQDFSKIRVPRLYNPRRDSKTYKSENRRAAGIHAYVGANGSGKSLAMVHDTLPTLDGVLWRCKEPSHRHMRSDYVDPLTGRKGARIEGLRTVLSTVELLEAETGETHRLYRPLNAAAGGWELVLNAEHCDILFDEVTGIAGSRESMGLPTAVQNILQQLRRRDVKLRWTAPRWERADSIIRGTTHLVTQARGYLPDRKLMRNSSEPKSWAPNRLFKWRTFNAQNFDLFTAAKANGDVDGSSKAHALRPLYVAWFWGKGSRAFSSYDTYGQVTRVAEYLDSGRCAICGGTRRAPTCKGDH